MSFRARYDVVGAARREGYWRGFFGPGRRARTVAERRAEDSGRLRVLRPLRRAASPERAVRYRFHFIRGVMLASGPQALGRDHRSLPETRRFLLRSGHPSFRAYLSERTAYPETQFR